MLLRTGLHCSIAGAWRSVTNFFAALATGIYATILCITNYLSGGNLLTARIDFVPGLTVLLSSFEQLSTLFDCACNYLSFFWDGLFALPASPSLIRTLDCGFNWVLRIIQMWGLVVSTPQLPDTGPPTTEFECFEISFGLWIEDVATYVGTSIIDLLFLIPNAIASNAADAQLFLPSRVTGSGQVAVAETTDRRLLMAEVLANSNEQLVTISAINWSAPWNWTAIAAYFTNVLETPWSRMFTYPIAGVAAFGNGTWMVVAGLAPLATNSSAVNFTDIQYFQVGYIMDWFRGGAVAFGSVLATLTTLPDLGPVVWGALWMPIGWVQIILEMARDYFFMNFFYPAATGDPFQAWTDYCNANTSQWAASYALLYNMSASLGILLGCNQRLSPYPLSSPLATCADSVLGGLGMNGERLVGETLQYPMTILCNLPMLLTFKPPLYYSPPSPQVFANPSNPPLLNWANMSLAPWARQWLNFGDAIQNVFYFFDKNANIGGGEPLGVACQYPDPTVPPLFVNFRWSVFCTAGNWIDALMDLAGSLVYPIITTINLLLGAIAVPELSSSVLIPTFGDAINNIEVLGCLTGGFIGTFFPTTFTCSAQVPNNGNPVFGIPQAPPPQLSGRLPNVGLVNRTDIASGQGLEVPKFCFYPQARWADTSVVCNCSAINGSLYTFMGTLPAPCVVECLTPTIPFPYYVGFNNTENSALNCTFNGTTSIPLVTTIFSNFSAMQTFLGSTFSVTTSPTPSNIGFSPYPALDPSNVTVPAYTPSAFMQQLLTARLNDFYNSIYQPQFALIPNVTAASSCSSFGGGGPETAFFTTILPQFNFYGSNGQYLYMHDFIEIITYIYYGQADIPDTADFTGFLLACNLPPLYGWRSPGGLIPYPAYSWGQELNGWLVQYGFADTARVLMQYLAVYNSANANCDDTSPVPSVNYCFSPVRIPTRTAPPEPAPPALPNPGEPASICTFLPSRYEVLDGGASCNCSQPAGYYYSVGNSPCLLFCDPPFPITLGARRDFCLTPAACGNFAQEISNITSSNANLGILSPNAPQPLTANAPFNNPDFRPGTLIVQLYTAILNLHYQTVYRPGQYLYVRPLTDQQLFVPCLGLDVASYRVFEGTAMSVVLDVINTLWLGNDNAPRNCYYLFPHGSPSFELCGRMMGYFTQWIDAGINLPFNTNTSNFIIPLLSSFNHWQLNCSINTSCFVASTFNPASKSISTPGAMSTVLNFTNPVFYTLGVTPIAQLQPCGGMIPCFTRATCSDIRVFTGLLSIVSGIITQINAQIHSNQGIWSLGQNIWQIISTGLNQELGPALSAILDNLSLLDCTICAIDGNQPFNVADPLTWPCAAVLFSFAQPIAVLFDNVAETLIGLWVESVEFAVNILYYFLSFQVGAFVKAIINYIVDVFGNFIIPFLEGLVEWAFQELCGCGIWNTFIGSSCVDAPGCGGGKRRWLSQWDSAPVRARYLYQIFASDWPNPARYVWNATSACATPMAGYATHPLNLTENEANEVAYCLARVVLYWNVTSHYFSPIAGGMQFFDECAYVMQQTPDTTPFSTLTPRERAQMLSCIQSQGTVYGVKQASNGFFDWLPDTVISHVANPFATWIPLVQLGVDSYRVTKERLNDMSYTDAVLNSPEYATAVAGAYGSQRLALLQLARSGFIAPTDDYTTAVLNGDSANFNRRRSLDTPVDSIYMARVSSLAETMGVLQQGFAQRFLPQVIAQARDSMTATAPPVYAARVRADTGLRVTTATTDAFINETFNSAGPVDMERRMYTIRGRTVSAIASIARGADKILGPEVPVVLAGSTDAAVLNVRQTIPRTRDDGTNVLVLTRRRYLPAGANGNMTASRRPHLLSVVFRGVTSTMTAAKEIFTGAALARATNPEAKKNTTAFNWEHTRVPEAASQGEGLIAKAKRLMGLLVGPVAAGPLERYNTIIASVWRLAAMDMARFERQRRLNDVADAVRNSWNVAVGSATLGSVPRSRLAPWTEQPPGTRKRGFTIANVTVPTDFCFNITSLQLCKDCFVLNQYLGYTALAGRQAVWYYNVSMNDTTFGVADVANITVPPWGPNPQTQNSMAYAYATFLFLNDYLTNITSTPLFVGNSASLPARMPSINHSFFYEYLDDTVQNKTRFTAWNPLFNATWTFLLQLLGNIDILAPSQWTIMSVTESTPTKTMISRPAYVPPPTLTNEFDLDRLIIRTLMQLFRLQPRTTTSAEPVLIGGRWVAQSEFRAAAYDTLSEILTGWAQFIWQEFIFCAYDSELDATNVRYSLIQSAAFATIPAVLIGGFIAAMPALLMPIVVLTVPLWSTIGSAVGIFFWIGFATGWKLLCFPTFPSIFFATMGMQALATSIVANKCPMWFSGLVREASYDNSNCMICDNWRNGTFTIFSCHDDLGWTSPFDVPIFWLKACQGSGYFCSTWLATLENPSSLGPFIASLLAIPFISDWIHRWDNVDLTDPIGYSSQYQCAAWLFAIWIVLSALLGQLLALGPAWQFIRWFLALFGVLMSAAVLFFFGFFVVTHAAHHAPVELIKRATARKRGVPLESLD